MCINSSKHCNLGFCILSGRVLCTPTEKGLERGGVKKRDDVLGEFESFVQSAISESQNIILSAESFDFPSFNFTAFKSYLEPSFQVKIVMTCRRFYDFFISYYNQLWKHGHGIIRDKNNLFISFGDWVLSDYKIFEKSQSQHTYRLYERFKKYDGVLSISVMNMRNLVIMYIMLQLSSL